MSRIRSDLPSGAIAAYNRLVDSKGGGADLAELIRIHTTRNRRIRSSAGDCGELRVSFTATTCIVIFGVVVLVQVLSPVLSTTFALLLLPLSTTSLPIIRQCWC